MRRILLISKDAEVISAVKGHIPPDMAQVDVKPEYSGGESFDAMLFDIASDSSWKVYIELQNQLGKPLTAICTEAQREYQIKSGFQVYAPAKKPVGPELTARVVKLLHMYPEPPEDREKNYFRTVKRDFLWYVLWGIVPAGRELVEDMARGIGMELDNREIMPVYVNVRKWRGEFTLQEKAQRGNYLAEKLETILPEGTELITISPYSFFAVLYLGQDFNPADLNENCMVLVNYGEEVLSCSVCCYIGQATTISALSRESAALWAMDRNNIRMEAVLVNTGSNQSASSKYSFDMRQWKALLDNDRFDELLTAVFAAMDEALPGLDRQTLEEFLQDFSQLISVSLKDRGLSVNQVLDANRYTRLLSEAPSSVESTLGWAYWSISELSRFAAKQKQGDQLYQVRRYIDAHLSESIKRSDLAQLAHFSQSHLLRLFQKSMGMSISQYITLRRIEAGARLLETGDLPVSRVAEAVGYSSCSHFYSQFRQLKGVSPTSYRAQRRDGENGGAI